MICVLLSKTIETKKNIFAYLLRIIAKYVRAKSVLRGLQKFIWLQKVLWEEEKQRPFASGIAVARGNDTENFCDFAKNTLLYFQQCLREGKKKRIFYSQADC